MNETEPDANPDGLIVYRQTPVGESLDAGGDLSILDIFEETDTPFDIIRQRPHLVARRHAHRLYADLDGTWQIYVYDYVEENLWLVSKGCETHCRLPAWSPDGKQVIYHVSASLSDVTPVGLWIANVEGNGKPRRYLEGPIWAPNLVKRRLDRLSRAGWHLPRRPRSQPRGRTLPIQRPRNGYHLGARLVTLREERPHAETRRRRGET